MIKDTHDSIVCTTLPSEVHGLVIVYALVDNTIGEHGLRCNAKNENTECEIVRRLGVFPHFWNFVSFESSGLLCGAYTPSIDASMTSMAFRISLKPSLTRTRSPDSTPSRILTAPWINGAVSLTMSM